jgi:2-haloacid dehalogenase
MAAARPPFAAVVFDAYGTLLDFNSAVAREGAVLGDKAAALSALWRRKQLEYSWLRSLMGRHADFRQVTGEALDYALTELGIAVGGPQRDGLEERLLAVYDRLDAYPEVPATLAAIKRSGLPSAILSNGTPAMLASAVAAAGLERSLDAVLSVEAAGTFKPHPSVYALATRRFGCAPAAIAFVSSNGWDIAGAAAFGFHAIWINRADAPAERLPTGPAATLPDLSDLPAHLAATGQPQ